jgi:uncharacterized protein
MSRFPFPMIAALALAVSLSGPAFAQDGPMRQITVTGEGLVAVQPDMAWLSLGVSHEALKASDAMAQMNADLAGVLALLAASGVAETDIQTGQLTLEQRFDYSAPDGIPRPIGYIATSMLDVRIRDLASLGTVLDSVIDEGANRLGGIRFDLSDKSAAMEAARRAAVADAMARATLYTEAAGVTLGPVITISEAGGYAQPMPMFDARMELGAPAAAVPVAAGEVTYQATVTITYGIE